MSPTRDPVLPGQESVWDYPRPPVAVPCDRRIVVVHRGVTIADTARAIRTLETSHPPSYYLPPGDVLMSALQPIDGSSFCEWKGYARYFDVIVDGQRLARAAWSYPAPTAGFAALRDHIAFYAASFDDCFVGGERVTPQPGGFYGGWITADLAGPFKGGPGSQFW
jgi:uncharacterized protein (DUF427 family)